MTATPRTAPSAFPAAEQAADPARGRASGRAVPTGTPGPRRPAGGRAGRLTAVLLGAALLALPLAACGEAENGADAADGAVDTDTTRTAGGTSDTGGTTEGTDEGDTENTGATGDAEEEAEGDAGTDAGTDAPEPASTDDPMVFNYYRAEGGRADRAPDNLVLTEFSTLNDVTWESWDGREAIGSGLLSGTWCLPDCLDDPFPAEVVLKDPEDINGEPYFTAFELEITDPSGYSQEMVEAAETEGFLGRP
ncbi:hypothetical protein [Streptomyces sp. ST2-7A]|uniref:hypothetical protein n=1 Tax=Streptomyces sp. ST2-7A TaxID=2907214 RepID=UPI001F423858|nr:hypothetical protein [Streptomyces sp. ST2-7A]MCE7080215.1 hypothetical protein [Streptomyces sp. ST2-7A]